MAHFLGQIIGGAIFGSVSTFVFWLLLIRVEDRASRLFFACLLSAPVFAFILHEGMVVDGAGDWLGAILVSLLSHVLIYTIITIARLQSFRRQPDQATVAGSSPLIVNETANNVAADQGPRTSRRTNASNFVARHWRGGYVLPIAFWVVGLGTNLFSSFLAAFLGRLADNNEQFNPYSIGITLVTIWGSALALTIWQVVGTWRSADNYAQERRRALRSSGWATAAKAIIVLGVVNSTLQVTNSMVPQLTETYRFAVLGDPDIPPYSIRVMRNGTEIEIVGGIKYGLADDFSKVSRALPNLRTVHLNSIGGRLGEAQTLARHIRDRGLDTYVSASCLSACVVAFSAGRERWAVPSARFGLHSGGFPGVSERDNHTLNQVQRDAYVKAGFADELIRRALSTPHAEMWYPPLSDLLANRVVTKVATSAQFAISGLTKDFSEDEIAAQIVSALPALRHARMKDPSAYQAIIKDYIQSYFSGSTSDEAVASIRPQYLAMISRHMSKASDEVLLTFGKLIEEQYRFLLQRNPEVCYKYSSGIDKTLNVSSYLSPQLIRKELNLTVAVMETSGDRSKPTERQVELVSEKVWAAVARKHGKGVLEILSKKPIQSRDYKPYCEGAIHLFNEVNTLPPREAVIFLRGTL